VKTLVYGPLKVVLDLDQEEEDILVESIRLSVSLAMRYHNYRRGPEEAVKGMR